MTRTRRSAARPAGRLGAHSRLIVQAWLGTRLLLVGVAVWVMLRDGRSVTDVLGNWDVQHFLGIAANGYAEPNSVAFFPGWPLVLRLVGGTGLSPIVGGAIVATVLSAVACAALYRLGGPVAAIAWVLAPASVFTLVPYTESLFCAAAFWAWERAAARHWAQAAALACVAASVRVSGLFLVGALFLLALTQAGPWLRRLRDAAWLVLPTLVLGGYALFTYLITGDPLAWFHAQQAGWARELTSPWQCLLNTWDAAQPGAYADYPEWSWLFRAELVSVAVGLVVAVVCLARRRLAEGAWVGVQLVAFSLSYWYMSVNRAVLLWFPLWTALGDAVDGWRPSKPRTVVLVVVVVAAVLVQDVWAWLFFTGRWAS